MGRSTRSPVTESTRDDRRASAGWTFADCLLDLHLCALSRAGRPIPLRPKAFHVLRYLLEHRDHLVTKDELCARVWPAQFISDATIESCIKRVRQAIGDTGRTQALIQTRRGYGYRFVATVEELSETAPVHAPSIARPLVPTAPSPGTGPRPETTGLPPADGERKVVTLLACTPARAAQAGRVGLDALHARMRTLYTVAREEVDRYGGAIHSVTGTRLVAVFGAPLALEDHARRALLAAWGLQQRMAAQDRESDAESLAVCLTLHTGPAILGGIGDAEASAIVGDLTLAVEALQERGAPGILLCSDATARLVRQDAELFEVTSVPVSGQPDPIRTYRVTGVRRPDASSGRVALRPLTPFVGRMHEVATLDAILAQAIAGRGQSVGIVGEPGIGKSRLLAEFRRQLPHGRVTYLESRCLSHGRTTPYLPVLELLRADFGIGPDDGDDTIAVKVSARLQALGLTPDSAASYVRHLLVVKSAAADVADSSPDTLKARTFAALRRLWFKSSQQTPLILAVEDLHWSDPTSEEFLASLVADVPGAAVLVLGTYRSGYRPPWVEKSYATQLAVSPLSAPDSLQVVRAVLGAEAIPRPLAEGLVAKAHGNPFFLEELAQALVEERLFAGGPASRSQARPSLQLPPTVEAVLAARIDRLSPDAKRLLQTAAVIGMDVPLPLLQLIIDPAEVALHGGLAQLQAAEFLHESHRFTERTYAFKHALTQEVAYDSLLLERRRALHVRIVEALEALAAGRVGAAASALEQPWSGEDQVERLAHHAVRGEAWAKALVYCRQAGEKAVARSAHREAASYFEQALAALPHLSDTRAAREQAIDLRLALCSALRPCGDLDGAMASVREAETLAAALDDSRRLGRVSVALSLQCYLLGAYDQAIAAAERARALAEPGGEIVPPLLSNVQLGIVYQVKGEYRRAIDCLSRTVALLDTMQSHLRVGEIVPAVFTPAYLAACHAELGTFAEGRSAADDGLRIAEAVDDPMSLAFASWGAGSVALRQGDLSRAVAVLEPVVNPRQEVDRPAYFSLLAAALGSAYALAGRVDDARRLLTEALERTMATKVVAAQALCSLTLGEAHLREDGLEEAQRLGEQALALARAHGERGHEAYARHLLGEIAGRSRPAKRARAEGLYHQALTLADGLGMRPLQAHCHHALGALYAQMGRGRQARGELLAAVEQYRTMAMAFWLPRAAAALARIG